MKRTDMVGKLSDVLLQFGNLSKQTCDLIADVMLSECEREGMLPPSIPEMSIVDISGWEPED